MSKPTILKPTWNIFCATGSGGGVDPTCKTGSGGGGGGTGSAGDAKRSGGTGGSSSKYASASKDISKELKGMKFTPANVTEQVAQMFGLDENQIEGLEGALFGKKLGKDALIEEAVQFLEMEGLLD